MRTVRMFFRIVASLVVVLVFRSISNTQFAKGGCYQNVLVSSGDCTDCACLENQGDGWFACVPGNFCGDKSCIVSDACVSAGAR